MLRFKDLGAGQVPKLAWVSGSSSMRWELDNVISKAPFWLQNELRWLEVSWEMVQKLGRKQYRLVVKKGLRGQTTSVQGGSHTHQLCGLGFVV